MRDCVKNGHQKYWLPVLEKKFSDPPQLIAKEEFDGFIGDFAVHPLILYLYLYWGVMLRVRGLLGSCRYSSSDICHGFDGCLS
jgi:hypothetical protein